MKLKFLTAILIAIIGISIIGCSASKTKVNSDAKKWTYFRILADADDDPIFVKLQDNLGINPKMERYTVIVNIKKNNPDPYVMIGDIDETSPQKFPWSTLKKEIQDGLLNWTRDNKERLD